MHLLQDSLMNMKSSKNSIYLNLLSKIMSVVFDQFDLALLNRNIIFLKQTSVIIIMHNNIKSKFTYTCYIY